MNITVSEKDMKIRNGFLNININVALEALEKMGNITLSRVEPGTVFNNKYIVLEHFTDGKTAVLSKDLLEKRMSFGKNNNFDGSDVDAFLNGEYLKDLENEFCEDQIFSHEIDLLSLDGLDDYEKIRRKVSLLTIDQYRKYRKILKENMSNWWWLATPYSTPSGYDSGYVGYVSSGGYVYCDDWSYSRGLRPFFILCSSIFVSVDKEKRGDE